MKFTRSCLGKTGLRTLGITPRRLAAARKHLADEAAKLPLLKEKIEAEQPTPEERIRRMDEIYLDDCARMRSFTARQWVRARAVLRKLPDWKKIEEEWNRSPYPKSSEYFADFVHRRGGIFKSSWEE